MAHRVEPLAGKKGACQALKVLRTGGATGMEQICSERLKIAQVKNQPFWMKPWKANMGVLAMN